MAPWFNDSPRVVWSLYPLTERYSEGDVSKLGALVGGDGRAWRAGHSCARAVRSNAQAGASGSHRRACPGDRGRGHGGGPLDMRRDSGSGLPDRIAGCIRSHRAAQSRARTLRHFECWHCEGSYLQTTPRWKCIENRKKNDVVLVPLGCTENHGLHANSRLDTFVTTQSCEGVRRKTAKDGPESSRSWTDTGLSAGPSSRLAVRRGRRSEDGHCPARQSVQSRLSWSTQTR